MVHQPLGSMAGMAGGRNPRERDRKILDQAIYDQQIALNEAGIVLNDLMDNPALVMVARELESLINQFLGTNEQAITLLKVINAWKHVVDVAPRVAAAKVQKLLGPQLNAVRVQQETPAAP